jgi:hypothetical protein
MKKCFFVSPIGKENSRERKRSDMVLNYIIKPITDKLGFEEIVRSDLVEKGGSISSDIIEHLVNDDLVIADLTGKNPNVFYELAIRHVTELPFIHIMEKNKDATLPFDVYDVRTIFYNLRNPKNVEDTKKSLEEQILSANKVSFLTPVSKYKYFKSRIEETDDVEKQILLRMVNEVSEQMTDLLNGEIPMMHIEIGQMINELARIEKIIVSKSQPENEKRQPSTFSERRKNNYERKRKK